MADERVNSIRIEHQALELLDRYAISGPGFDIEDLAAAEGLLVRRGGLKNIEAWLIRHANGTGTIRIRDDDAEEGRIRFSIGHEIGHWRLHPTLSQGFLCTAADLVDYTRSTEEIEANLFAASLLVPRTWVPDAVWRVDPDFELISKLAKDFRITLTAATRRYTELAKHPVLMVFSKAGKIEWTLKSQRARSLYIERATTLPIGSLSRECWEQKRTGKLEQVDAAAWFPDRDFGRDFEVFEDTRVSQRYGSALTLLWVPGYA
jgi:Zn-dependent peptidase ImmA (M78 family)